MKMVGYIASNISTYGCNMESYKQNGHMYNVATPNPSYKPSDYSHWHTASGYANTRQGETNNMENMGSVTHPVLVDKMTSKVYYDQMRPVSGYSYMPRDITNLSESYANDSKQWVRSRDRSTLYSNYFSHMSNGNTQEAEKSVETDRYRNISSNNGSPFSNNYSGQPKESDQAGMGLGFNATYIEKPGSDHEKDSKPLNIENGVGIGFGSNDSHTDRPGFGYESEHKPTDASEFIELNHKTSDIDSAARTQADNTKEPYVNHSTDTPPIKKPCMILYGSRNTSRGLRIKMVTGIQHIKVKRYMIQVCVRFGDGRINLDRNIKVK